MEILVYFLLLLFFLSPFILNNLPEKEETKNWNMLKFKLSRIANLYSDSNFFDYIVVSGETRTLRMETRNIYMLYVLFKNEANSIKLREKHLTEFTDIKNFAANLKQSLRNPEKSEYRKYSAKLSNEVIQNAKEAYDLALKRFNALPTPQNFYEVCQCFKSFFDSL